MRQPMRTARELPPMASAIVAAAGVLVALLVRANNKKLEEDLEDYEENLEDARDEAEAAKRELGVLKQQLETAAAEEMKLQVTHPQTAKPKP